MNIMKSTFNTCSFCHKGPKSKANHQENQIPYKNFDKNKVFPTPMMKIPIKSTKNSPKHNLRIKISEKSLELP